VLDDNKRFLEFRQIRDLLTLPNQVVLMAGGMGNRLKEITSSTPKPMLKIGGKPILETIIDQFSEQNFNSFYISVNHFADQIVDYFQDGDKKNVNVKYLHEKKRLGTAGCLSLIDEKLNEPFFVMNGDILTDISFPDMLRAHKENKNEITIGTVYFSTEVPYGVIKEDKNSVLEIEEKPTQSSLVSAGIYILNHDLIQEIPKDEYFDITQLFEKLLDQKRKIGVYKIQNYWLDIGHPEDYFKAQNDFENYFN
jgi:NDP-sugar pyrophosphorylase family protein